MSAEDFDDAPADIRICGCGCSEDEHDARGCRFCGECDGFTLDEEASLLAAIGLFMEDPL